MDSSILNQLRYQTMQQLAYQSLVIIYNNNLLYNPMSLLLKCEAAILNRIYDTTLFENIVIKSSTIEDINYYPPLQIYKNIHKIDEIDLNTAHLRPKDFVEGAHLLCKSKSMQEKRETILCFDKIVDELVPKNYHKKLQFNIFHVIIFSSLSKCTIWPNMFKTSRTLVPSLIEFYNRFFNQYTQFLEYKFDPLILSPKFSRLVKQIKQKKLANPELFHAVQTNNVQKIKQIVSENDENILNECMKNGLCIPHAAAIHSSIQTMRFLLQLKANFECLDEQQQTPLFYAVKRFDLQIIKFLIEEVKVNINHQQYQNRTPIYLAAFQGKLDIVEYLHSKGGNPEIQSKLARTPLSKACYLGNVQVADYLIKLGVKLESVDSKGRTALHNAAWGIQGGREGKRRGHIKLQDSPDCVELLLKAGHKIDFQDHDKFTPLFSAISSCAHKSLRILVKHGANLKHKTIKNQTAVFIACKYGHLQILKILIEEYNCDIFQQSIQGYTPLMAVFTLDKSECLMYMLDVFMQKGLDVSLNIKWLECLRQFQKWQNLNYLQQWLQDKQSEFNFADKASFLSKALEQYFNQIVQFSFELKKQSQLSIVLTLLKLILNYLRKDCIQILIQNLQQYKYINDTVIQILLHQHAKGLALPHIELNNTITQEMVIKLLQIDTNLTESQSGLYATLLEIIRFKLTKVIIFIISCAQSNHQKTNKIEGIYKFTKKDILGIIYGKVDNKMGVIDFCLVNGHYDIHKLLRSFYNENYQIADFQLEERPRIPHYQHVVLQLKQIRSYLMPIPNIKQLLSYEYITKNYLTQQQIQIYKTVIKDIKSLKMNALLVKSLSQLKQMIAHLESKKLIGIDIQHYSSNSQSFICLIQIATMQRVFVIDRFSRINQEVKNYLKELFADSTKIKIFHSYDNDLKWLVQDYSIQEFHSILDSARISSLISNKKNNTPSLKSLALIYLNLQINKEYQRSDWRIRPLFKQMINYAAADAKTLPFILLSMLQQKKIATVGKVYISQAIKMMESKKLIRHCYHRNMIQIK